MKHFWIFTPLALMLGGCSNPQGSKPTTQAQPVAQATTAPKLTAVQDLGKYCRVCVVDKKEKMEEFLPTRLNVQHKGNTYKFCSEPCRKKFDASPAKYALKVASNP